MTTNHDSLREAFNAFLMEQHERHKHQHNHFHVARNEWARRTQSTQYEALAASKPEQIVCGGPGCDGECCQKEQAAEPAAPVAAKPEQQAFPQQGDTHHWPQQSDPVWPEQQAKKDAALQACVAHMLIAYGQNSHDMILTGDELRGLHAAITKAEEARK